MYLQYPDATHIGDCSAATRRLEKRPVQNFPALHLQDIAALETSNECTWRDKNKGRCDDYNRK